MTWGGWGIYSLQEKSAKSLLPGKAFEHCDSIRMVVVLDANPT